MGKGAEDSVEFSSYNFAGKRMKIMNREEDDGTTVDVAVVAHDGPQDLASSSTGDKDDLQNVAKQSLKKKMRKRSDV
ncbi:hypothetical protein ACH5RR_036326 [Cinchona calisaya]|uniref:Uncharacterized protein n=1 Tax=Cinchona calisaya TaxID=153742 RepID=A0ABD2Y625_9GENT